MRKYLTVIGLVLAVLFTACQKEKVEMEEAGEIPGMGNAGGELEATPYAFHEDLQIGDLTGVGSYLKSGASDVDVVIQGVAQGSGEEVIVTFEITNSNTEEWRSAYFRAGTVIEVDLPGYQNGILLAPVIVCLSPGETRIVTLYFYCVNRGLENSDGSASYKIVGVTESELMLELVTALAGKMVNYEHYMLYYQPREEAAEFYMGVKQMLQEIIWRITNGEGMTTDDYDYVGGLPVLPDGVYPDGIFDLDFKLPTEWCDGCGLETAYGGINEGPREETPGKNSWWYYYDATEGGQKAIYAGQFVVPGAYVEVVNGVVNIHLGDNMFLIDDDDAVKIGGYNIGELPTIRPTGGSLSYKGRDLSVNIGVFDYYVIHLDVGVCK